MNYDIARNMLLWCLVINVGIMLFWFIAFANLRKRIYQMHGKWFKISEEHFDAIHYTGMAIYKILIIVFNIVPLLALQIACKS